MLPAVVGALALAASWPGRTLAQSEEPAPQVEPPAPPPGEPPPPPAGQQPGTEAPPPYQAQPEPVPPTPQGQWVFTQQYGWVWMPYGQSYTYVPPGGTGEPEVYVFYPAFGWRWVVAPWVWGIGPWPNFGAHGPGAFFWYRSGWWRTPSRWHFAPAPAVRGFEGREHGFRPGPPARVGRPRPGGREDRPSGSGRGGRDDDRGERRERGRG
jgi:hypothetical protein